MPVAIGVQHATLNWEDPSCHCGPARHTEHRGSQLIEENDEGEEGEEEEEGGEETDIKSNNPHLTGGEQPHLGLRLGDFFVVYQLLQGGGWTQCIYICFTCCESSKQNSYILWCWTNVYIVWHPVLLSLHIKENTYLSSEKHPPPPVPFHPTMIDQPHKILITPLKRNMTLENHNFQLEIHLHSWRISHWWWNHLMGSICPVSKKTPAQRKPPRSPRQARCWFQPIWKI